MGKRPSFKLFFYYKNKLKLKLGKNSAALYTACNWCVNLKKPIRKNVVLHEIK